MRLLPGRCPVCGTALVWNGSWWRNAKGKSVLGRHACPAKRERCNAVMYDDNRCGRKPGHKYEHRSDYALENDRRRRVA